MQAPENINYNAFRDPDESELKVNDKVKLSNSKSMFSNKPKQDPNIKKQFEKNIQDYQENQIELSKRIAEATNKYVFAIKNKILPENRSPLQKEVESDIVKELIDIGYTLNNDQTKPEGIGSMGLINLLLKINLQQRDMINELAYKVETLEKKISS